MNQESIEIFKKTFIYILHYICLYSSFIYYLPTQLCALSSRYSVYPFSVLSRCGIKHPKPIPFFGNIFLFRQVRYRSSLCGLWDILSDYSKDDWEAAALNILRLSKFSLTNTGLTIQWPLPVWQGFDQLSLLSNTVVDSKIIIVLNCIAQLSSLS